MKDPAFLFYSNDFYEGTRLMLPKERACLIDLMIYQHQHGFIPNDPKRLTLYCSGIDEATLKATLKAKFKQTEEGWYNERLRSVVEDRAEYSHKQSINGRIGQVMKRAKKLCNASEYKVFRDYFYNILGKEEALQALEKKETTLQGLLKASLKHLENVNVNEDISISIDKKSRANNFKKEVLTRNQFPAQMLSEFVDYWTESNDNGKKMRFEYSKNQPFNIDRRLATWNKRQKEWGGQKEKKTGSQEWRELIDQPQQN